MSATRERNRFQQPPSGLSRERELLVVLARHARDTNPADPPAVFEDGDAAEEKSDEGSKPRLSLSVLPGTGHGVSTVRAERRGVGPTNRTLGSDLRRRNPKAFPATAFYDAKVELE